MKTRYTVFKYDVSDEAQGKILSLLEKLDKGTILRGVNFIVYREMTIKSSYKPYILKYSVKSKRDVEIKTSDRDGFINSIIRQGLIENVLNVVMSVPKEENTEVTEDYEEIKITKF